MRGSLLLAASLLALSAAIGATEPKATQGPETIGVTTQDADGTLVLQLRATGPGGMIGDALVRYRPGDPHYEMVRRHVGPIPTGGSVFVRPFPD